jgi:hypothetical protein
MVRRTSPELEFEKPAFDPPFQALDGQTGFDNAFMSRRGQSLLPSPFTLYCP